MTHPADDQLLRLLADQATPDSRDALDAHVNRCDECLARLEALRGGPAADVRLLVELLVCPPTGTGDKNGETSTVAPPSNGAIQREDELLPRFSGYDLLAQVGGGGMGEVYKARHLRTNRVVALKTVSAACPPGSAAYQSFFERIRQEAEAASRLQHANVVTVYDV